MNDSLKPLFVGALFMVAVAIVALVQGNYSGSVVAGSFALAGMIVVASEDGR